ncbi:MAG: tetratricopeptide repeat protein [Planctomycetes bacterium]|nr:tetratricopeptide repeat protein [Planctomycetota bacterium]
MLDTPQRPSAAASGPRLGQALLVALLALAVRATCIYETRQLPTVRHPVGDAAAYVDWARRISAGDWLGRESFYQAPLYPYILAVVFRLLGDDLIVVRLVQAAWGAAAAGCLFWATWRMSGRSAAWIAGLLLSLYAPAVYFDIIIQKASLDGLLVAALLVVLSRMHRVTSRWTAGILGAVGALLALTRENAFVWLPLLAAWVWARARPAATSRPAAASLLAFLAGVSVVLAPVGARNWYVGGEWSFSTFQAGPNFYIGNGADADGRYRPLLRGREIPAFERLDATRLAEAALGRTLSPREVSRYWLSRAFHDISADPVRWLRLLGYKLLLVVNRYEIADAESLFVYAESSWLLGALSVMLHFGTLLPLAVLGYGVAIRASRAYWIHGALAGAMCLAVAAFYVLARYKYPLVPLLVPFAAAGCVELWRALRDGALRLLSWPLPAAAVVAVVANVSVQDESRLDALAVMNTGVAAAQTGDLATAEAYFERAVRGHPASAEANNNLAQVLALQGRFAEAIPRYDAALAVDAALPGAEFNLAVALEAVGRIPEALQHYRRALHQDPVDEDARAAIARITTVPR